MFWNQRKTIFPVHILLWLSFINGLLDPELEIHHVSVHSISSFARASLSPADDTHKIPLVVPYTHQWSTTVSLACVNFSLTVACTTHAHWYFVSQVVVSFLTFFTWHKGYYCLLQNLEVADNTNGVRYDSSFTFVADSTLSQVSPIKFFVRTIFNQFVVISPWNLPCTSF